MKTFNAFLAENAHLEHAEDFIINSGVKGTNELLNYFNELLNSLSGKTEQKHNISLKVDGAPAVFCGTDPADGKFFVATKGLFAKTPTMYKNPSEVPEGDLGKKLAAALKYLPELGITGIVSGDFMYTHDELKSVDGNVQFHPNTIVYSVPEKSALGKEILKSKIGVCFHTRWEGEIGSLTAKMDPSLTTSLKHSNNVWVTNLYIKDISGTATLTAKQTKEIKQLLAKIKSISESIPPAVLNEISNNKGLLVLVKQFQNSHIKVGGSISDQHKYVEDMVDWLVNKLNEKNKSDKGLEERSTLKYFVDHKKADIAKVFEMQSLVVLVKKMFLEKLNAISGIKTFIKTPSGFRVTGHEGFVVSDHIGGNAVKLVDRIEFSRANFSTDTIRGWQK